MKVSVAGGACPRQQPVPGVADQGLSVPAVGRVAEPGGDAADALHRRLRPFVERRDAAAGRRLRSFGRRRLRRRIHRRRRHGRRHAAPRRGAAPRRRRGQSRHQRHQSDAVRAGPVDALLCAQRRAPAPTAHRPERHARTPAHSRRAFSFSFALETFPFCFFFTVAEMMWALSSR